MDTRVLGGAIVCEREVLVMCLLCVVCVEPGATESSTIQACVFHVSGFEISCLERGSRSKPTSNILLSSPPLNLSKCRALPVVEKEDLNCKHTMPRGQACIFLLSHAAESAGRWNTRNSSIVTNERFCGKSVPSLSERRGSENGEAAAS